ncbi:MAG TPA: 3-hydroxyacyl-CoA dehydrogenase family protein [Egibacteraceae bacterium]|nr:3-hydroxyacyl-CoA dehydrogenase family protein [Egibacteraceae bacterium]
MPRSVGVVGGGTMGAGIAHVFLAAGARVALVEADDARGIAALDRIDRSLRRASDRGHLGDVADALERLRVGADLALLADCELAIECVPEDPELKAAVLADAERSLAPDALLASNTSALSIDVLARRLQRPKRFVGMHFFNPVPASQLVEIVRGTATDDAAVADARAWAELIGKQCIEVRDSPGFASTRLGMAMGLEAIRMVEEGAASPEDIDTAMVLGYKVPVGPLRLTDLIGLDVRLAVAEYLHSTLGDRFRPPQLLRDKVGRGELGRKSGQGFYSW